MTHWRARSGQILVRDENDEWHWVTPATTRRTEHRFLLVVVGTVVALLLTAAALLASARHARAEPLPFGLTCLKIIEYSEMFPLPNTPAGRARAKTIGAALGVRITDAQLDEAARCLRFLRK